MAMFPMDILSEGQNDPLIANTFECETGETWDHNIHCSYSLNLTTVAPVFCTPHGVCQFVFPYVESPWGDPGRLMGR